jgi:chromosome segregation ATPase
MLDEELSSLRTRQAEMKTFNVTLKTELEAQKRKRAQWFERCEAASRKLTAKTTELGGMTQKHQDSINIQVETLRQLEEAKTWQPRCETAEAQLREESNRLVAVINRHNDIKLRLNKAEQLQPRCETAETQMQQEKDKAEKLVAEVGEWKEYAKSVQATAAKMPMKSEANS